MRIEIHGALAAALCLTMTTPVVAGVKIFGTNVSKDDICPGASTSKCVQESLGATGTYVGSSRRYVNIDTKGTPDFAEYLARTYHRSLPKGQPYCRGQTDNVLQSYAERVGIPLFETPLQSTIDFKVKAKKLIDVGAGFDAVKVAKAAWVPSTQTENVATAIPNSRLSDQEITTLSNELCTVLARMPTASSNFVGAKEIEKRLLRYFKVDVTAPDYRLEIAKHWNYYSNRMICPATNGTYPTQHIYKRALAMNYHTPILDEYFFADEVTFPIDPNVVEVLEDGSYSTVLDYIDAMLSRPDASTTYNIGQVAGLGEIIVDFFGGKRVREMSADEIRMRTESLVK